MINHNELFEAIKKSVCNIETELKEIDNEYGIFFAPELYVAFCIGMEIKRNKNICIQELKWLRELNLNISHRDGGPTDIVFTGNDIILCIEVKLRDTFDSYKRDIEKLLMLKEDSYRRYFCVLTDSFGESVDNRLIALENYYSGKLIEIGKHSFESKYSWYVKPIHCLLKVYNVKI